MKRYSLADRLPDRLPMTPQDEPMEPDLSRAYECVCRQSIIALESRDEGGGGSETMVRIQCLKCYLRGPWKHHLSDAVKAWNRKIGIARAAQ